MHLEEGACLTAWLRMPACCPTCVRLQESFDPIMDLGSNTDLLPVMLYARRAGEWDYSNCLTLLLRHKVGGWDTWTAWSLGECEVLLLPPAAGSSRLWQPFFLPWLVGTHTCLRPTCACPAPPIPPPACLQGKPVVAAICRVFGPQMAELPLIATRNTARRQGHARILVNCFEDLLKRVGAGCLLLGYM